MKLKKLAALVCGAMVLSTSVSFATVPDSKISIGKVEPGMAVADLVNAYGQPIKKFGDNWYYSNFVVEVDMKDAPTKVEDVSSRNNTLGTMSGVTVGQDASVLNAAYGQADNIRLNGNVEEYEYFNDNYTKKMKFTVLNQVIVKIKCSTVD